MSAASDNALAAAGMRSALGNIDDSLFNWKVKRPLVDAQTRAMQLQNQLQAMGVDEATAKHAAWKAAQTADVLGASAPPASPAPAQAQSSSALPDVSLSPGGVIKPDAPVVSVDNPASVSAAPAVNSPLDLGAGLTLDPNSVEGQMALKKAKSSAPPKFDINRLKFDISPPNTNPYAPAGTLSQIQTGFHYTPAPATRQPASAPAAPAQNIGSGGTGGATVNPGSTTDVPQTRNTLPPTQAGSSTQGAPAPAEAAPATVSSPGPGSPGFGVRLFSELSPAEQRSTLKAMRAAVPTGTTVGDHELAAAYNENQLKALTINPYLMQGMTLIKYGANGPEFVNSRLLNGQDNGRPQPFLMAPDGSVRDNPDYLKPADLIARRGDLATTEVARQLLDQTRSVIQKNPEAYGQLLSRGAPGTDVGQAIIRAKAMFGNDKDYTAQRVLEMQNLKGMLDTLGQVHIGRVTEMEWGALANSMPKLTDNSETWNSWLGKFDKLLNTTQAALQDTLRPYGYGNGQSLPDVGPGVTAPGQAQIPTVTNPQQLMAIPKGSQFQAVNPATGQMTVYTR